VVRWAAARFGRLCHAQRREVPGWSSGQECRIAISTIAFSLAVDPDRSRVRAEGSSGAAPQLQRRLFPALPLASPRSLLRPAAAGATAARRSDNACLPCLSIDAILTGTNSGTSRREQPGAARIGEALTAPPSCLDHQGAAPQPPACRQGGQALARRIGACAGMRGSTSFIASAVLVVTLSHSRSNDRPVRGRKNSRAVGPPGRSQDQGGYQTRRDIPSTCSLATLPSQPVAGTKDQARC
jgi:hypothetical protein